MDTISIFQEKGKVILVAGLASILLIIVGLAGANLAAAQGAAACDGTYLVEVGQSEALWSFSKDGIFQATDSAEIFLGFSHQQGAWRHAGANQAKATWLDFSFNPTASTPAGYARIDADLFFDNGCDTLTGTLGLRLYGPSDDPLDPAAGFPVGDDILFTGRRINP